MKQARSEGLNINLPSMPWWVREDVGGILRSENNRFPWNYEKLFTFTHRTAIRNRKISKGQRIHESVIDRIRDQTLQPPYTPKATGNLIPQFWKLIDEPQWKEEWIEPWGYEEQTEKEVAFENQAQTVMQIPKDLVPKVHELIIQYQSDIYRG